MKKDIETSVCELKKIISEFVKDRDWEQFHSPKNLSMSIAIEAAELMEHFQWVSSEESKELMGDSDKSQKIKEELADIAIYILEFSNLFGIDLSKEITDKLDLNASKYPINKSKGNSKKYTELG